MPINEDKILSYNHIKENSDLNHKHHINVCLEIIYRCHPSLSCHQIIHNIIKSLHSKIYYV